MNIINTKQFGFNYFLKGFCSAFTLSGHRFLEIPDLRSGFERDRKAIAGDWQRIGSDIKTAIGRFAGE